MPYALISGATGVLGKAYTIEAAKRGYDLILTGRSEAKLSALSDGLKSGFPSTKILFCNADLTKSADRDKLFSFILDNNLKMTLLINVAGVDTRKAFLSYNQEKLTFQARVNFEATLSLTLFALNNYDEKLKILTVSSLCGITPMPYFALYSASKAALDSFFDALRVEVKGLPITLTTVAPSSIYTRKDIIEDIKKQGLSAKFAAKTPEYIVQKSFKALDRKKRRIVPGGYNKFVSFVSKLVPKKLRYKFLAKKFKNLEKDAF